jgi:hypothetical protein
MVGVGVGTGVGVFVGADVGVGVAGGAGATAGVAVEVGLGTVLANGAGVSASEGCPSEDWKSEHPVRNMASIAPTTSRLIMDFDISVLPWCEMKYHAPIGPYASTAKDVVQDATPNNSPTPRPRKTPRATERFFRRMTALIIAPTPKYTAIRNVMSSKVAMYSKPKFRSAADSSMSDTK